MSTIVSRSDFIATVAAENLRSLMVNNKVVFSEGSANHAVRVSVDAAIRFVDYLEQRLSEVSDDASPEPEDGTNAEDTPPTSRH